MEKEAQPDSMATVTIKPDYPPSEVYSSEPPPAYHRSQSSTVQVAKIIAVTVVLVSFILGGFILASAYVTATASCRQLEQELELFSEAADRFQAPVAPEALVQDEPQRQKPHADFLRSEETKKNVKEVDNNNVDSSTGEDSDSNGDSSESNSSSNESEERTPIHIKLPLQLDFDDLAGALMEKNKKSRMNCVVEKKHAEEIVDHQPKTLRLPFGLNLTTDPRYERVSGERMAIFCESGDVQKQAPPENDQDDQDEETIMIQPVMIPIPQSHFPTHMPQQLHPVPQRQPHPMETMRPPVPPQVQQFDEQSQLPPNQVLHHIAQEIIAQKIMEAQRDLEKQNQETRPNPEQNQQFSANEHVMTRRIPIPEEILSQLNRLPNRGVIVAVSQQEYDDTPQETRELQNDSQEMRGMPQGMKIITHEMDAPAQEINVMPQEMRTVLQQITGVPQEMRAQQMHPVQPEMRPQQMHPVQTEMRAPPQAVADAPQEMHVVQQQRENAQEMTGSQTYARVLPIRIPVHMVQQDQAESRAVASEETRPHYVQPRSVRSVDALLPKSAKRVKRCACDCVC